MMLTWMVKVLQSRWRQAALIGLALALISGLLLVNALLPAGEPVRLQATLAPTLWVPPLGVP